MTRPDCSHQAWGNCAGACTVCQSRARLAFLSADIPGSTEFFQYGPIALWTTLGVVGATAVYYFLTKRSDTPNRSFTLIAVAVLVLSFLPDLGLALFVDDVTNSEAVSLMVLHLPPAFICVAILTGWLFNR
ncbi:DUF6069 family protein [Natrialba swarupiae]|uniref:DUF6069 family protein n=1 Tax=Natrialba swarupiae TaxID=2448032 RepID=UPI0037438E47